MHDISVYETIIIIVIVIIIIVSADCKFLVLLKVKSFTRHNPGAIKVSNYQSISTDISLHCLGFLGFIHLPH